MYVLCKTWQGSACHSIHHKQYSTGQLTLEVQTHKAQRLQLQEGAVARPGSRNGAAREVEVCQGCTAQAHMAGLTMILHGALLSLC